MPEREKKIQLVAIREPTTHKTNKAKKNFVFFSTFCRRCSLFIDKLMADVRAKNSIKSLKFQK